MTNSSSEAKYVSIPGVEAKINNVLVIVSYMGLKGVGNLKSLNALQLEGVP